MAPDGCDGASPDIALSERLAKLSDARGEIAWPETVTRAMTALKTVSDRVASLVDRVSVSASSLGELAAARAAPPAGRTEARRS